jgi:hypothetical protein
MTPEQKIKFYQRLAQKQKSRAEKARQERDGAAAHAVMAGQHILSLNQKLNSKRDKAGKGRVVQIEARIITTGEGRAEAAKQRKAREEKESKAAQRKTEKEDEAAAVRARRLALGVSGISFGELKGSLKSQKVQTLRDVAWSMALDEKGTKDVLVDRIEAHLTLPANSHLRTEPRYGTLLSGARGTKRTAPSHPESDSDGADGPPSPQRRRLDDLTNSPRRNQPGPSSSSRAPFAGPSSFSGSYNAPIPPAIFYSSSSAPLGAAVQPPMFPIHIPHSLGSPSMQFPSYLPSNGFSYHSPFGPPPAHAHNDRSGFYDRP